MCEKCEQADVLTDAIVSAIEELEAPVDASIASMCFIEMLARTARALPDAGTLRQQYRETVHSEIDRLFNAAWYNEEPLH